MVVTMKAFQARQIEARSRARRLGVRVEVLVPGRHYRARSQSNVGASYNIDRTFAGWQCECDGYRWTGCCKHLAAVERRSEREGWDFGRIAHVRLGA